MRNSEESRQMKDQRLTQSKWKWRTPKWLRTSSMVLILLSNKLNLRQLLGFGKKGITYIKGSSILKQIFYLMGFDNFSNALATYFRKYRWENTSYRDFFDTLQAYLPAETPFTFEEFNKQWLLTTGVNTLSVEFDQGEIDSVRVLQSSDSESQPLRVRKTKLALFYEPTSPPRVFDVFIEAVAKSTVKLPEKVPAPNAVLINYDDEDYCKVLFDQQSNKYFSENLFSISDPMVRGTIYKAQ